MDQELRLAISQWLADSDTLNKADSNTYNLILVVLCLTLAGISYLVVKRVVIKAMKLMSIRSKVTWDDTFVAHGVLEKFALLVPLLIIEILRPLFTVLSPYFTEIIGRLLTALLVILLIRAIYSVLNAIAQIADEHSATQRLPITSFIQLIKLFLFFVAAIITVSILSNQSPIYFLSGLGVATGFIMLIFRDTILGFVAGIQLATNQMVTRGDWIQMDKYGADGTVEEVSLTTVKVRNFDKTITMLPAYALVSDAFTNWRGMSESGGRRIKRSVFIDIQSIGFLTKEDTQRLSHVHLLKNYLADKSVDINTFNLPFSDDEHAVNSRGLTNIGTFRAYLLAYLRQHPKVRKDMTLLVRQLAPTTQGMPIEIYIFTDEIRWAFYEDIQADIFDHIFSVLPSFGLQAFQQPSSNDVQMLMTKVT
ncbi:mechanosensitive ion channel family protein [Moritella sp. F3]|uniref:mechanosensitive ion channel family protein n=1 Tax=Moritella sp. F3 TaxID=2718882 RepID=UPI0018E1C3B0|nr:mechanosensitive ion channel family protein [Moritella sp. F3]GIC75396.1 small conductance mechanosensitive ion channel protein YbdG [Moritella sp. F1]GIC80541.1 small conductance mechanosensitive ion channel protein YbdG [Moritella sp. F3]